MDFSLFFFFFNWLFPFLWLRKSHTSLFPMQYLCSWLCLPQCTDPSWLSISPYPWEGVTPCNSTICRITSRESPDGHGGTKVTISQQHTLEQRPRSTWAALNRALKAGKRDNPSLLTELVGYSRISVPRTGLPSKERHGINRESPVKGHRHKGSTGTSVISSEAETAGTVHPGEVSWGILPVGINIWSEGVNKADSSQQYTGTGQEASHNEHK